MPPQALAAVAALLSFAVHGNRIELQLDHGSADLTWVSPGTFRFRRALEGPLAAVASSRGPVEVKVDDTPGVLRLRSKYLEVAIQKRGLLVTVRRFDGEPLMNDLSEPRTAGESVSWDRAMPPGVRFYGLGRRTDPGFDLRGKTVAAETPFLLATSGYGEYHVGGGAFQFDFTSTDRYRIQAPRVDYFFYYGPKPKEIFEERHATRGAGDLVLVPDQGLAGWDALKNQILRLTHGAMSALLGPGLDLGLYSGGPADLLARARQIGSLLPGADPGSVGFSDFRKQLGTYFASYGAELRDKGFPVWHPLPFQFPDDPECAGHADEFMLGDELLIAPIYDSTGRRRVYLPPGIWTSLESGEAAQGRRSIEVATSSLPVYARNGTIVPLDSAGGMALHYFPTLAAEFFLLESAVGDWSKVHAAPAADIMRLEIESKVAREYQWVVHHVERPVSVGFEEQRYRPVTAASALADGAWFYDPAGKNLQVRVRVAAGEDSVIHVRWP